MTTKKTRTYSAEDAKQRDSRYTILKYNLDYIATQHPRLTVLYPMMDKAIYQDFETLVATVIEDADAANDND